MEKRRATIIFDDEDVQAFTNKHGKEKSHPVRVRESTYKSLRLIAFKNNMKITDLVDYLVIKSMKDSVNK